MASPARVVRPRRSQAARRADTRRRLLDATLLCLEEQGYARTTTALIEARAGVSRGARLHHFPTKADLLIAAVEHLVAGITQRYAAGMEGAPPDGDRFHRGYRLLWESIADGSGAVVIELFVAARTDPELREALRKMWTRHHQEVRRRANATFPELATPDARGLLETLQSAMTGLALRRLAFGENARDEEALELLERMVKTTFEGEATARPGDPR